MRIEGINLPKYKCHKEVWALKIIGIDRQAIGTLLQFEGAHLIHAIDNKWVERHNPQTGGYLVMYIDGYVSYSPAKAFEEGYTLV